MTNVNDLVLCSSSAAEETTPEDVPTLVCERRESRQVVLLLTPTLPWLATLAQLTFDQLHMGAVLMAVGCLRTTCPALKRIFLISTIIDTEDEAEWDFLWPALAGLPALRSLVVEHGAGRCAGLGRLLQLEHLSMNEWEVLDDALPLSRLVGLTKLALNLVESTCVEHLTALTALCELELQLEMPDDTVDAIWAQASSMVQLTSLTLRVQSDLLLTFPLTQLSYLRLHTAVPSAALNKLQTLTFLDCCTLEPPELGSDVTLKFLRVLDASSFSPYDGGFAVPKAVQLTFPALECLTLLDMSCKHRFANNIQAQQAWVKGLWPDTVYEDDGAATAICLADLTLRGTDFPLAAARSLVALDTLSLTGPCRFDFAASSTLSAAALHLGKRLTSLGLHDCDDASLIAFVRACPHLKKLNLMYCHTVTDVGLVAIAAARGLRHVALTRCPKVSTAALMAFAVNPSVVCVHAIGCDLVTAAGALSVWQMAGRPELNITTTTK